MAAVFRFLGLLAFVHLYTLFMVVPIFNTMMRIDKSLIEAARDGGATGLQILYQCHHPADQARHHDRLDLRDLTLVMGDFVTVRFMSGSQSANVGRLISNDVGLLQYPSAAATSVVLLMHGADLIIGAMLRVVDIRKELVMEQRPASFYVLGAFFGLFMLFLYGPTITIAILSFQGPDGGLTFPMRGVSLTLVPRVVPGAGGRRHLGQLPPQPGAGADGHGHHGRRLGHGRACVPAGASRGPRSSSTWSSRVLVIPSILVSLGDRADL